MNQICLIDAKNFLYRNHYTHRHLSGPNGEPTSVLYSVPTGLLSLHRHLPETPLVMVWDGGGETWRHRFLSGHKRPTEVKPKHGTDWVGKQIANSLIYLKAGRQLQPKPKPVEKPVGYKANRVAASSNEDRVKALSQIPELKRALRGLGIRNYKINGLEGDDLIGILTSAILKRKIFDRVLIYSADTDFYQLISKQVGVVSGIGDDGELHIVTAEEVYLKHQVQVDEWTKYRAITGDVSDNIPHLLLNVGPVKARRLLRAGVDASKGLHELPQSAINALMDMTKGTLEMDDFWPRLRKNYIACKILTSDNFMAPEIETEVADKITGLLAMLCEDVLVRDEGGRTQEANREFCEWCVGHGMYELKGRVGEFADFV